MMRSVDQLDAIAPAAWTREEAYWHCRAVFDHAARFFPELMEPYLIALGELPERDEDAERAIMWRGLRETIAERYA